MDPQLRAITEQQRRKAPCATPQALAFHDGALCLGSRDERRIFRIDPARWEVLDDLAAPGIPWAAVSTRDALQFTIGEGVEDDRFIRRFIPAQGFSETARIACPDYTGSYLSFDGEHLYLSQWYKGRILKLDDRGNILRSIEVGAEICGHTFVDGVFYVLRGTEAGDETWQIARLDPREETPVVRDLARVPFQCRSLAFDSAHFWTNHRAAGETVMFTLPTS